MPDMASPALARGTVDRAAERRRDEAFLDEAWRSGRVLVLEADGRVLVGDDGGLLLVESADQEGERFFLGLDRDGTPLWAVVGELPRKLGARPVTLRDVGAHLSDRDAGLYVTAIALANWHATHRRCPRCGEPTMVADGGWVRRCLVDGTDHFPRTDPAVIVLVHDGADRCLLGRQPSWPRGRYSTLAGFVEPGESLEQAVAREIREESGVDVDDIVYRGSQPWPFPASLMLGFEARAVGGDAKVSDDELEDVRWFSREDLRRGEPMLPPPASIAHWLIVNWLSRES
ncbi:MAG: diphosphatase [Frankiaceae bacterium]|jgi:NAD+ diphosphatase|nr:diphosphatase [Frankiaceae bacterium]